MALPVDQVIRERRFLAAYPEWTIMSQDRGERFTAERDIGAEHRLVCALSLRELMDRLETIVESELWNAGQSG